MGFRIRLFGLPAFHSDLLLASSGNQCSNIREGFALSYSEIGGGEAIRP
jgi:hypothetical protein